MLRIVHTNVGTAEQFPGEGELVALRTRDDLDASRASLWVRLRHQVVNGEVAAKPREAAALSVELHQVCTPAKFNTLVKKFI